MRIIELDKAACETSDYIFNLSNLENYKVKSVNADINNLTLHKNGYEWDVENFKENTKYTEKNQFNFKCISKNKHPICILKNHLKEFSLSLKIFRFC